MRKKMAVSSNNVLIAFAQQAIGIHIGKTITAFNYPGILYRCIAPAEINHRQESAVERAAFSGQQRAAQTISMKKESVNQPILSGKLYFQSI